MGWCLIKHGDNLPSKPEAYLLVDQDRDQWRALVKTVLNLGVPLSVGKFLSGSATGGFSRSAQLHGVSQPEAHQNNILTL
jgi:hypothetical protein